MREAVFDASGPPVGPVTLDVYAGQRAAQAFETAREAEIAARMAAGIVKANRGSVLLEAFDPRVQSAHCKRIAGFVPHDPLALREADFERYILYRAALWGIDPRRALAHARLVLERLDGVHEAFAYPIAGALIADPKLLVLDRPAAAIAGQIAAAAGPRAIFSTHVRGGAAQAFAPALEREAVLA